MVKQYTVAEEIANSVTHGIGVLFSIVGLTILLLLTSLYGTTSHFISYLIYGSSLILLYTTSTLYHALPYAKAKKILQVCDHAAIYLLIAGSYTPFLMINLQGNWGWGLMGVIWGLAFMGVIFKVFYTGRFERLSVLTYLGMGWLIVVVGEPMWLALSSEGIMWIAAGGVAYTLGTIFYCLEKLPFNHAIWHLFVLTGSVFHFIAVIYSSNLNID